MLIKILKTNPFIHFFTNSFLLLNFYFKRGKKNKISGYFKGIFIKTSIVLKGNNNSITIEKGVKISNTHIYICGLGNNVFIGRDSIIDDSQIWIMGNENKFSLSANSRINNAEIGIQHNKNIISGGESLHLGGYQQLGMRKTITDTIHIYAFEGTKITFGHHNYISDGVIIRTSDSHPIYNEGKLRINNACDISVGSGCWIGSGAAFLKGAKIGDNSIVGLKSLITKDFSDRSNIILAGSPAKAVRNNITWDLEL